MSAEPPSLPVRPPEDEGPLLQAVQLNPDTAFVRTDGKILEVGHGGQPPTQYCIKCGRPSDSVKSRDFAYIHPAWYLMLFAGVLPFLLIALLLRKSIRFQVGLCSLHRAKHIALTLAGLLGVLGGLVMMLYGLGIQNGFFALAGLVFFLIIGTPCILFSRVLNAKRVDERQGIFTGASPQYLERIRSSRPLTPSPTTNH